MVLLLNINKIFTNKDQHMTIDYYDISQSEMENEHGKEMLVTPTTVSNTRIMRQRQTVRGSNGIAYLKKKYLLN